MVQSIKNLPIGSKIKFGKYKVETEASQDLIWKIADKDHAGYPVNAITLITEKIIDLRGFDAKEPNNSDNNRKTNGNNRYKDSNLRQWLNKGVYPWFAKAHTADEPPTEAGTNSYGTGYDDKAGFLSNFTDEEIAAILNTTLTVAKNTVTDGGGTETVVDKIFLASVTEAGLANEPGGAEGSLLPIFSGDASRIAYLTQQAYNNTKLSSKPSAIGNAWYWWLRSPYSSSSSYVRGVRTSGTLLHYGFAYSGDCGVRPLCNLKSDILVSDTTDADGCYTIVWNKPPTITGKDENLGDKNGPFVLTYQVNDPENDPVIITEKLNNTTIKNLSNAPQNTDLAIDINLERWSALAINTEHTIAITAKDDKDNISVRTIKFTKVNAPPIISGTDKFIGDKNMPFTHTYQVNDPDGDTVTVVERLNGTAINTRNNVAQNADLSINITKETLYSLAIDKVHTISIEASDDKGNVSYRNITFRRVNAAAIITTGTPNELGEITSPPTITYQVSDPEGDAVTVNEYLDGQLINTISSAPISQDISVSIDWNKWVTLTPGEHTIKVKATDILGAYSEQIFKFTRFEDVIDIEIKNPIETEVMLAKIVPVVNFVAPAGFTVTKILATNNAFDVSPTWEDVTTEAIAMKDYTFTNTTKTAEKWGFSMRVVIATEEVM